MRLTGDEPTVGRIVARIEQHETTSETNVDADEHFG
jgi:hypothetical protein